MDVNMDFATSLLEMFEVLDCPFTENIDASYLIQFLLNPSPQRMQLLAWVISCIDNELSETIHNYESKRLNASKLEIDGRVQLLTEISSQHLCICGPKDFDLIRGKAPEKIHLDFWKNILSIATAVRVGGADSINEEFHREESDQENMLRALNADCFSETLNRLPITIERDLQISKKSSKTREAKPNLSLENLSQKIEDLETQLDKEKRRLECILNEYPEHKNVVRNDVLVNQLTCSMHLLLGDLRQLQTTYNQTHDNNLQAYCKRDKVEYGKLGLTIHHLQRKIEAFLKVMDELQGMRTSHESVAVSSTNFAPNQLLKSLNEVNQSISC
uniref:Uncharacterized protein n=1 Tax=Ciona savignyi TaxID=51511 RepID=H2Z067_CIOSA